MLASRLSILTLTTFLSSCVPIAAGTVASIGITELDNQNRDIRRSIHRNHIDLDGLELGAMPLNGAIHLGRTPFLVCVGVRNYRSPLIERQARIEIELINVKLELMDGRVDQPSGYLVRSNRCPNFWEPVVLYQALLEEEFTPVKPVSVKLEHRAGTSAFTVLVLQFDRQPPDPMEDFKLYLGSVVVAGTVYSSPPLEFSLCSTKYC
jgi:hypothetical protein